MKRGVLIGLAAMLIAGCADMEESGSPGMDEPIETKTGALLNAWTPWFTDYVGTGFIPYDGSCGSDDAGITAAACRGSYCDDMRLYCGTLPAGFTPRHGDNVWWAPSYISDENPAGVSCPPGFLMFAMSVTGAYSDNLQIGCAPMNFPPQGVNCKWMTPFSEEQGQQNFDYDWSSYAPAVAVGVKCSGPYCDNLSFYVCEPRCTSHADCSSACNFATGRCTIG